MIPRNTVDKIFETAKIEEVVGDFVQLKRSGASYRGFSPWNKERTPSFYVLPAKGIFKDFSSGRGGNVVHFLMELESFSYVEALRYLAKKYNIEIEEIEQTPEQKEEQSIKESLALVNKYAAEYFEDALWNSDEGKNIGLSYFRERGFNDATIKKFSLGYSFDKNDALLKAATGAGYNPEFLNTLGLVKQGEHGSYDFFRGRVMFPIRNVSGRPIAFAGRTLKSDNPAKYMNSPESEWYDKSKTLYGIYEARRGIMAHDRCILVEGYTDVISLHQAGVDYAVASAGTSLTAEQARLIKRYTNNVMLLYDGDSAGIKASMRGIDILLGEGCMVKVVPFPEGHDPDSYARSVSQQELFNYIQSAAKDFTEFMAGVLLAESPNDPATRVAAAEKVLESIACIPDPLARSAYTTSAAKTLGMQEQLLVTGLNKLLRKKALKKAGVEPETLSTSIPGALPKQDSLPVNDPELLEKEIVRIMLTYGNRTIALEMQNEAGAMQNMEVTIAEYVIYELSQDNITLKSPSLAKIMNAFQESFQMSGSFPDEGYFIAHDDQSLSEAVAPLLFSPYELSTHWADKHHVFTNTEESDLKRAVFDPLLRLKLTRIREMIETLEGQLKSSTSENEIQMLLTEKMRLDRVKSDVSSFFGTAII